MTRGLNSFRRSDGGKPDAESVSVIQTWPIREAPESLRRLVDSSGAYEWLAFVPAELNQPDVVSLMLRDTINGLGYTKNLADGALLLAGRFVTGNTFPVAPLHRETSKNRKARSAGR